MWIDRVLEHVPGERLVAVVDDLLADPDRLRTMSERMAELAAPAAASGVADLVERHGRRR